MEAENGRLSFNYRINQAGFQKGGKTMWLNFIQIRRIERLHYVKIYFFSPKRMVGSFFVSDELKLVSEQLNIDFNPSKT